MVLPIPGHLRPHHRQAVDNLVSLFEHDPRYLAIIIGGSVAKGIARENSDVDLMIICTDEEYARRAEANDFWYWAGKEVAGYEGGYFDGKYVDLKFIEDCADHGSETARSAFVGAFLAYSHLPGLEETLARIPLYPEHERAEKLKSFVCQVMLLGWFISEAEKREDKYLLTWATSSLTLFGGRVILAHNRILFPYHKWLMKRVEEAPEKPENFMELTRALLENPTYPNAKAYCDAITTWQDWGIPWKESVSRFMMDAEWNWREHRAPLTDW